MTLRCQSEIIYSADLLLAVWRVRKAAILELLNCKQMCCEVVTDEDSRETRPDGKQVKSIKTGDPREHEEVVGTRLT